jgi:DNA-binding XRE family transcriptional regulator
MDFQKLIKLAKEIKAAQDVHKHEPYYYKTIAWLHYLGLLRHNKIPPRRYTVTLAEALKAGELEPRVLELIPAILVVLPKALKFKKNEVPDDLAKHLDHIRKRQANESFRGIEPQNYLQWLSSPIMDIAKRRVNFHRMPRERSTGGHAIGAFIRTSRLRLALTQKQLAEKHNLSLRIIRDLEQGKMDASLKATNDILKVFGHAIKVSA